MTIDEQYKQAVEWFEGLKQLRELKQQLAEIDLSIPQHFTKEQSEWIKAYCIQKNKEFYDKAIDDYAERINTLLSFTDLRDNGYYVENLVKIARNELKAGDSNK